MSASDYDDDAPFGNDAISPPQTTTTATAAPSPALASSSPPLSGDPPLSPAQLAENHDGTRVFDADPWQGRTVPETRTSTVAPGGTGATVAASVQAGVATKTNLRREGEEEEKQENSQSGGIDDGDICDKRAGPVQQVPPPAADVESPGAVWITGLRGEGSTSGEEEEEGLLGMRAGDNMAQEHESSSGAYGNILAPPNATIMAVAQEVQDDGGNNNEDHLRAGETPSIVATPYHLSARGPQFYLYTGLAIVAIAAMIIGVSLGLVSPVRFITTEPTQSTVAMAKAFATRDELHDAVWAYANESQRDAMLSSYGDPIGSWDVSRLSNFSGIFVNECHDYDCPRYPVDVNISGWDVSGGTDFSTMFWDASSFNSDLSKWDVSSGTDFSYMFWNASSFNSDLSQWNVSRGTDFSWMFSLAPSFNADLSQWDVSMGTDFSFMFSHASSFNSDLSRWDVSRGTDFSWMFYYALLFNAELSQWDVSRGTDFRFMFAAASSFNHNLCSWGEHLGATYQNLVGMFAVTACPLTAKPQSNSSRPFCHECT